jgi:hypothetical protein
MHPLRQRPASTRRRQSRNQERRLDHHRSLGEHAQLDRPGGRLPQGRQLHTTTAAASPGISSGPTTGYRTTSPARWVRQLGLHRRHLRQGRRVERPAPLSQRRPRRARSTQLRGRASSSRWYRAWAAHCARARIGSDRRVALEAHGRRCVGIAMANTTRTPSRWRPALSSSSGSASILGPTSCMSVYTYRPIRW